jgi:cyclomaltodextrinase / maltogenic alpha-amylase / neopullulanase
VGVPDSCDRAPYPWKDEGGAPDEELLAEFKKLIALRNKNPVLRHGSIDKPLYIDDHVIVWLRDDGKNQALVAANNDSEGKVVHLPLPASFKNKKPRDIVSDSEVKIDRASGMVEIQLEARYGAVIQ